MADRLATRAIHGLEPRPWRRPRWAVDPWLRLYGLPPIDWPTIDLSAAYATFSAELRERLMAERRLTTVPALYTRPWPGRGLSPIITLASGGI